MHIRQWHAWDVSPEEARRIQGELRDRVLLVDEIRAADIKIIAGADNAYPRRAGGTTAFAAVVLLSFPKLALLDVALASTAVECPYIPGLLSFREAPALLRAFAQVSHEPDLVLFDGQGYAHPRRMGLASHLGVLLDLPSIGCAKSRLVGRYEEPAQQRGAWTPLVDRGEEVGAAVRTRPGHAPLLVSPGTRVSIAGAVEIVLACCRDDHFMPEPTRLAHLEVTRFARSPANPAAAS